MGMPVRIVLYAPAEPVAARATAQAFSHIASLDAEMSDYRPDSALSEIGRRAPEPAPVPPDLFRVISRALVIARATAGAFDPTVAPIAVLWREARKTGRRPDAAALDRARALVAWELVEMDPARQTIRLPRAGMKLDLGGIAKGYIVQAALGRLKRESVSRALVEAGGDLVTGEAPPGLEGWRIELPDAALLPRSFVARAAALRNSALSTSGPAMQSVEIDGIRYSHVIDPRTGQPLTSNFTAHVIDADASLSDALATAAAVLGPAGLGALRARFPDARIELIRRQR